jgi:anti-sigma factor RsiW
VSGQVFDFSKSDHQRTLELLPWFVNATLAPAEHSALEQHLADCVSCRRELDAIRELSDAYLTSEMPLDVDRAFERLRPRLVLQNRRTDAPGDARTPRWRRWDILVGCALAAQLGIIVALGWALFVVQPAPPTYVALGSADGPLRASGDAIVVFSPEVEVGTMRRILAEAGAHIVDGPTAANGLVVRFDGRDIDTTIEKLRAEPAVRIAARLDQAPRQ